MGNKALLWYQTNPQTSKHMNERDIVLKKVIFRREHQLIVFCSSVPDSYQPITKEHQRVTSIANFLVFETEENGHHKLTQVSQTDMALKGAALIGYKATAPTLLAQNSQLWYKKLIAFLDKDGNSSRLNSARSHKISEEEMEEFELNQKGQKVNTQLFTPTTSITELPSEALM